MADKKISELTAASSLVGTELLPIVQDGETKKSAVTTLSSAVEDYLISIGAISDVGPARLFASGEQGTWYDPSDFSSLYQDSAGTTPVTAVEQPVGKVLDKSGNGNHATQSTTTSRPILRNMYNLLTYTEQFDNAVWIKTGLNAFGSGSVANTSATTDPLGGNTADFIQESTANSTHVTYSQYFAQNVSYTFSVFLKAAGRSWVKLINDATGTKGAWFDLSTGAVGSIDSGVTTSITSAGSGWYRCTITATLTVNTVYPGVYITTANGTIAAYAGDGTSGIYIWGASLVPANEASLPYQRVVTNTLGSGVYDSDVTKFPPYLYFDGTDDFLVTGNIDFSATDKMSVFAGVRKLSDAAGGFLVELSSAIDTNAGTFGMLAPNVTTTNRFTFASRGSLISVANATGSTYDAPITVVGAGISDISGDSVILRVNGAQAASSVSDQGTGNFGTYPLYIGRRGGTYYQFKGRIYSLITRGALTTTPLLEKTEQWVATKTGVTL